MKKFILSIFPFWAILYRLIQDLTELGRLPQTLQEAAQCCTAWHPAVTSVALWLSVQLCPDCSDGPGFADA